MALQLDQARVDRDRWQQQAVQFRRAALSSRETVTVRATRWRERVTSDTVLLHLAPDTVQVPVTVVRTIVAEADTTIRACTRALDDCHLLAASLDSVIAAERQVQRFTPKPEPGWKRWGKYLAFAAAGYLAGR